MAGLAPYSAEFLVTSSWMGKAWVGGSLAFQVQMEVRSKGRGEKAVVRGVEGERWRRRWVRVLRCRVRV